MLVLCDGFRLSKADLEAMIVQHTSDDRGYNTVADDCIEAFFLPRRTIDVRLVGICVQSRSMRHNIPLADHTHHLH